MKKSLTNKERLFNPNYIFNGDPSIILKNYPMRSKNLQLYASFDVNAKNLNFKFVKDGYMYLLREAINGQESGFYSRMYHDKKTIENAKLDPNKVALAQNINGDTPFISATTDLYTAASFSKKQRIYILKLLTEDVYTFYQNEGLMEDEYMIPDYIQKDEIINSFKYNKFRQIYNYLTNVIGLKLTVEDLGLTSDDLEGPDMNKLEMLMFSNFSCPFLDPVLKEIQSCYLEETTETQIQKQKRY